MKIFSKQIMMVLASGLVLLFGYTNCSQAPGGADAGASESSSITTGSGAIIPRVEGSDICETDLLNLFARGFHSFARQNCVLCHQNGPGKGRFAAADVKAAYADFMQIGSVKISANAVNSSHQPPSTGPQHIQLVNELKIEWQKGITDFDACRGQASSGPNVSISDLIKLETTSKMVPVSETVASGKVTWDLAADLKKKDGTSTGLAAAGGKFEVTVQRGKTAGGQSYYLFTQPRIYGSKGDLRVKGLFFQVNGQIIRYQTTFRFVDTSIRASTVASAASLISTGSLVVPGATSAQDQISAGFEIVEVTSLPPEPPPLTVQFEGAGVRFAPAGTGFLDLPVVLSAASTAAITVSFETAADTNTCFKGLTEKTISTTYKIVGAADCFPDVKTFLCAQGKCAAEDLALGRARSVVGVEFNRFDWDYKFQGLSLTFQPGETKKILRVQISKDLRAENNRLLSLSLASVTGVAQKGALPVAQIVLHKRLNPLPDPNVPTFSELMDPRSGILGLNCLKCHNSTTKAGGYDMSNYDEMVANGVLVPGQPDRSKMFKRLNPNDAESQFLQSMPLDGFMEQALIREVERWLLDGAKNN